MSGGDQIFDDRTQQTRIEAQAAERLIARLHDSEWNENKEAELETWLAEDVAHEVAYLRLEAGWRQADRLSILRSPVQASPIRPPKRPGTTKFHVAAVLLLCAAVGTATYVVNRPTNDQVFATPIGGRETITLADGSQIELNTNTEIRLTKGSRQATLVRGEAYFQIKHDAEHPFTLEAGGHRIVDLGTRFSVRQKADNLQVTLMEGRARIEGARDTAHAQSAVLKPGDVAFATRDRLTVTHRPTDALADVLSWRNGFVVFHHTSLRDAVSELNRYNAEQIVVADDAAARRAFGGKFRTTDSRRFADVVGAALSLHVEHRANEIVISGK